MGGTKGDVKLLCKSSEGAVFQRSSSALERHAYRQIHYETAVTRPTRISPADQGELEFPDITGRPG